jgi:hypothetical protein
MEARRKQPNALVIFDRIIFDKNKKAPRSREAFL